MKVLKHGKMISSKCTCGLCGAELEYDFTDIETQTVTYSCSIAYISCPECGHRIQVSDQIEDYFPNKQR
ncbi:MAG: hypothetical protein J6Y02_06390 [Pseudobutyrivibrio sp.]|nr:hypothetical protein [Pseudobutyrivibrio sp.]